MNNLMVNTGVVTYKLNDACEVVFNPTDIAFAEKICNVFEMLEKKQTEKNASTGQLSEPKQIFELARSYDKEMRALIDDIFGISICDALFGNMNIYALANGLPLWCNLLLAIMDEINDHVIKEQTLVNPRIAKYLEKYKS